MSMQLGDWVQTLGWALLHFIWQGALVGALYAFLRWLVGPGRTQARYALGLGMLALLALLPVLTIVQLAPGFAAAGAGAAAAGGSLHIAAISAGVGTAVAAPAGIEPWLPWLVGAWLIGVCLASLRALRQYWRVRELCHREATPLPEWDARLRELCRRFRVARPVRLVKSAVLQTPSLIGWLAPVIVLPASCLVGLTPHQVELVIAHELGHIRRWDYAVNLLQIALETVLFYHPVVHWISREVRNEREACCDDLVLRLGANPVDYAATLASLEELRHMTHTPALAATGGSLLGRIRRIVGAEPAVFAAPLSGGQGVLLLALAFAAFVAVRPVTDDMLERIDTPLAMTSAATPAPAAQSQSPTSMLARSAALALSGGLPVAPTPAASVVQPAIVASEAAPEAEPPALELPRIAFAPARPAPPVALPAQESRVQDLAAPVAIDLDEVAAPVREPLALERVAPVYPRRAQLAGLEGSVTLSFTVDAAGRARDIRVAQADVPGEFEGAATSALRDWRFAEASRGSGTRFTLTFDFALHSETDETGNCEYSLGSRICRRFGAGAHSSPVAVDGEAMRNSRAHLRGKME